MITLHTWKTPNGRKPAIALEELGLPYVVKPVELQAGAQREPAYLALNPNGKIPTLVDEEGVDRRTVVFETGAILEYLAHKTGRLLPADGQGRATAMGWLTWSVASFAPNLGRWGGFKRADPQNGAALETLTTEVVRLFGVLERRLGEAPMLAGEYGMADISTYTWADAVLPMLREHAGGALGPTPNVERWLAEIGARPAVRRGYAATDLKAAS